MSRACTPLLIKGFPFFFKGLFKGNMIGNIGKYTPLPINRSDFPMKKAVRKEMNREPWIY